MVLEGGCAGSGWWRDRIVCGDAWEVLARMPDHSVHLVVTSPPYNVGMGYDGIADRLPHEEYLAWLYSVWEQAARVLVRGGRIAVNIASTGIRNFMPVHHDFARQLARLGLKFRAEIIWHKNHCGKRTAWGSFRSPSNPHVVQSWEYVLVFSKGQDRLDGDKSAADITSAEFILFSNGLWQIAPERRRRDHPAPFPEALVYRLIKFYTYRGNTVLDMFGGTGTVAAVAARTGRHFVHIDISPRYCEIARERVGIPSMQVITRDVLALERLD